MKTQLKNQPSFNHSLNKMNDKTYQLRKKVIDIIYEVKKLCDIPRIEVRIVSGGNENNCGYAYLNTNIIHINETFVTKDKTVLMWIVLHELVHAITGFKHDENCPLMCPYLPKTINEKIIIETFLKYITK